MATYENQREVLPEASWHSKPSIIVPELQSVFSLWDLNTTKQETTKWREKCSQKPAKHMKTSLTAVELL